MNFFQKKSLHEQIESHDYWMTMAFMFAVKSKTNNACVLVNNANKMISYGVESSPEFAESTKILIPAEVQAIVSCKSEIINANLYTTSPPSKDAAMTIIACTGIKGVYYYPKENMDLDAKNKIQCVFVDVNELETNLNWIRDYFDSLET